MPMTVAALKYLTDRQDSDFPNLMPVPSREAILLCDDKYLLNQKLAANGFGAFVPRMGDEQTYPYILKKRIDAWGVNTHIVSNPEQEKAFSDNSHPDYFKQQLITGPFEYATHIIFKDGRIVCSLNVEYKFFKGKADQGKGPSRLLKTLCLSVSRPVFSGSVVHRVQRPLLRQLQGS